jgi:hypothetical protein
MNQLELALEKLAAEAPVEEASWDEVLGRARRTGRRRLAAVALGVVAAIALAAPAFGVGRLLDLFEGSPVSSDQLSPTQLHVLSAMTNGVSPRTPSSTQEDLARVGAADLRQIAERDGTRYFVANRQGGGLCVSLSHEGDRHLLVEWMCSTDFPSPKEPVLDKSVFGRGTIEAPQITRLEGFAADGVASVGVLTQSGDLDGVTDVEDNVYQRVDDLPDGVARGIVALDAAGRRVYVECLSREGCG